MNIRFVFFGTDEFAVTVLETLKLRGLIPQIVVTTPDKPKGRKLILTPSPVKVWAEQADIKVLQPEKLKDQEFLEELGTTWDLFIVAAYGKIIPEEIFNLPRHKTLNIHPSLLPELRGPSPVATAILNNLEITGVTIMQIDAQMDHGPIVVQKVLGFNPSTTTREVREKEFAIIGAHMLTDVLNDYIEGKIVPQPQDDSQATYCHMITKDMGLLNLSDNPYKNWLKILALQGWPGTYFFVKHQNKQIRVSIRKAHYADDQLIIDTVVPEGKKEMSYPDFLRGMQN